MLAAMAAEFAHAKAEWEAGSPALPVAARLKRTLATYEKYGRWLATGYTSPNVPQHAQKQWRMELLKALNAEARTTLGADAVPIGKELLALLKRSPGAAKTKPKAPVVKHPPRRKGVVIPMPAAPAPEPTKVAPTGYVQPGRAGKKGMTVYTEPEVWEAFKAVAEMNGMGAQQFLTHLVTEAVARYRTPAQRKKLIAQRVKQFETQLVAALGDK